MTTVINHIIEILITKKSSNFSKKKENQQVQQKKMSNPNSHSEKVNPTSQKPL